MYHEIADNDADIEAWTVVKKSEFLKQMEYLSQHFNIVSLDEALRLMMNSHPIQKPTVVITFDDGYLGNKRVLLPIVKSMNIPVTIFVSTKAIQEQTLYWYDRLINALQGERVVNIDLRHHSLGRYHINQQKGAENWREIERLLKDLKTLNPSMREHIVDEEIAALNIKKTRLHYAVAPLTMNDLLELADCELVTIGAHSHCHNILTQLSEDGIRRTVETSKKLLESWSNVPINHFSYPNGNYNDVVCNILKEKGFICSLTTESRPWRMKDSFFTIPRIGIGRYDSFEHFKVKVSGVFV